MKAEYRKGCRQRDSVEREGYTGARSIEAREGRERDGASGLTERILNRDNLNRAYKQVKRNRGAPGIDGMTVEAALPWLRENRDELLQNIREGRYKPSPVRRKEIPKPDGSGVRKLGIPTVGDRVAQMVVKTYIEPRVEAIFHTDSYGYRPNKSAIDAIRQARKRCWKNDYVVEFDIKGLFDNIDHDLLMRAVRKHISEAWILMYIERWLKAPFINAEGQWIERKSGTPQGGVISPVLANLFMHYAFDLWMKRTYPNAPFERYADDAIIHCRTQAEAEELLENLKKRLEDCKLELHPTKTKIVYCKDKDRAKGHPVTEFEFLGYTFRRVFIKDKLGRLQFNFLPSVSVKSAKAFRDKIKSMRIHSYTGSKIEMIAEMLSPMVRGWINYFTKFNPSAVR